jgi:hypothetical protein
MRIKERHALFDDGFTLERKELNCIRERATSKEVTPPTFAFVRKTDDTCFYQSSEVVV